MLNGKLFFFFFLSELNLIFVSGELPRCFPTSKGRTSLIPSETVFCVLPFLLYWGNSIKSLLEIFICV